MDALEVINTVEDRAMRIGVEGGVELGRYVEFPAPLPRTALEAGAKASLVRRGGLV